MALPAKPKLDWKKIEAEYIQGGVTYQELADKYKVAKRTIDRHGTKADWAGKRRQVEEKVSAELPAQVAQKVTKELSTYLSEALDAVNTGLALSMEKLAAEGLEFKTFGEAASSIARLAKAQADLVARVQQSQITNNPDDPINGLIKMLSESRERYTNDQKREMAIEYLAGDDDFNGAMWASIKDDDPDMDD